jgi:predicted nucleic acid-binding protein
VKKAFLDTNVLVYANDRRDPAKQARAIEAVTECIRNRSGVVSTQVLQEYAAVATRKLGQDLDTVLRQLALLESSLEVVQITPELVRRGLELQARHQISYWDATIVAAAERAGCSAILSQDFPAGQLYAGCRGENPFASEPNNATG